MEVLGDEDGPAMTDLVWFRRHGICVVRLMTDKAVAYRGHAFQAMCASQRARHLRPRPN